MAEALGLAASIIAAIQISETVAFACYTCYNIHQTAKDAQSEILAVLNSVTGLKTVLVDLQKLVKGNMLFQNDLATLNESIQVCQTALENIGSKLRIKKRMDGKQMIGLPKWLMWMWKRNEIDRILAKIEMHKTTFILILGKATMRTMVKVNESVGEIATSLEELNVDQAALHTLGQDIFRKAVRIEEGIIELSTSTKDARDTNLFGKVLKWLAAPDPTVNHEAARNKHEQETGNWFLELDEFIRWKQGQIRSIWIHGIPGAGKTILVSTIVEHMKSFLEDGMNTPLAAFFYFDFNDSDKRTVNGMLRSVLHQFCIKSMEIFDQILNLYKESRDGNEAPTKRGLVKVLDAILTHTGPCFICLDALDESAEREDLSILISELLQFKSLRLLFASRKEQVFVDRFHAVVDSFIDLRVPEIDQDIYIYIKNSLASDRRLRKWPPDVKDEIERTLSERACGMFRWVECQLETLRNCLTVPAVRKALSNLPRTLDETYARILTNIPPEYAREAHIIFQLLSVSYVPLTLEAIAEAIAIDTENNEFHVEGRLANKEDILEICGGLVAFVPNLHGLTASTTHSRSWLQGCVRFAHYSVQEYLMSTRIVNPQYMIITTRAHQLGATLSLIYLFYYEKENLDTDLQDANFTNDLRNFYNYAVRYWFQHYRDSDLGEQRTVELIDLCVRFLEFSVIPLEASIYAFFLLRHSLPLFPWDFVAPRLWFAYRKPGSVDQAVYWAAIFGFNDVVNVFLQRGANIDFEVAVGFGNPLTVAIDYGNPSTVQFLLDRGADVDVADSLAGRMKGDGGLLYEEQCQTLTLSTSKSDGYMGNLLARAIGSCRSDAIVQCLLDHGADANSCPIGFDSLLQEAVARNKESIVRMLLDNGAKINTEGNNAGHALHTAIYTRSGGQSLVRLLLEGGADIHAPGRWYASALHAAAEIGDWEVTELLIEKGAEVDRMDHVRWTGTALQAAVYNGHTSVVKVLLKHGANPFSEGGSYGSPFETAFFMENLEIVQLLCPQRLLMSHETEILNRVLAKAKSFRDEEKMGRIVRFLGDKLGETAN